jgi:hypothetical protein
MTADVQRWINMVGIIQTNISDMILKCYIKRNRKCRGIAKYVQENTGGNSKE